MLAMSTTTIYHNPACSNSRNTLALLRERGIEPQVIDYLKTPPTLADLQGLAAALQLPVRDILRRKDALYAELDLDNARWSDAQLLDVVAQHPALLNRPIVVTPLGTRLCRPPETVLEILG
jgi:arsenate reductase